MAGGRRLGHGRLSASWEAATASRDGCVTGCRPRGCWFLQHPTFPGRHLTHNVPAFAQLQFQQVPVLLQRQQFFPPAAAVVGGPDTAVEKEPVGFMAHVRCI